MIQNVVAVPCIMRHCVCLSHPCTHCPSPWETVGQVGPQRCLRAQHQPHTHPTEIRHRRKSQVQKSGKQGPPSVVWTWPCLCSGPDDVEAPSVFARYQIRKGIAFRGRH